MLYPKLNFGLPEVQRLCQMHKQELLTYCQVRNPSRQFKDAL